MIVNVTDEGLNTEKMVSDNDILVSVIIPVYNVEKYLERCIDSIINQTYENIEIICVNDGSTDKSGEILEHYAEKDSRIVVIHKKNGGLSSARNAAFPYVHGRYVYFVDADDWIESNALKECVSPITDDVDIVISGVQIEDEGGFDSKAPDRLEHLKKRCAIPVSGKFPIDDTLVNKITSMVGGKLWKYDILKQKELIFFEGHKWEDILFTTEFLIHAKICYFIHQNLYHYVQRPGSLCYSKKDINDIADYLYIFDNFYKRLNKFGLLKNHKGIVSKCYNLLINAVGTHASSNQRKFLQTLATQFAQHYDSDCFTDDLVAHVKNKEYGLVPAFDEDTLIILKPLKAAIESICNTIKSLFAQSYKVPNILLHGDAEDTITKEDLIDGLTRYDLIKYIDKNLFISSIDNFSLEEWFLKFQNHIILTAECGVIYPKKWLRCIMSAYEGHKEAFDMRCLESIKDYDEETLFKDFAILDFNPSGKVTVYKSKKLIVSLTSYPARIHSAALSIQTIYEQTKLPNEVTLWLAESDFPNKRADLPEELLQLVTDKGIVIRWCEEDLKPHNKYFWAFKEYPDALVITVDDDILYHSHLIENLYQSYLLHPQAVSAARAHLIVTAKDRNILPYTVWPKEIDAYVSKSSMRLLATGVGGVLYPTRLFSEVHCLLDKETIKRTCLYQDDFWLKVLELFVGIPVVVSEEYKGLCYTPDSQDCGLWHENVDHGRNDRQLLQIQEEIDCQYGKDAFRQMLKKSFDDDELTGEEVLADLISYYRRQTGKKVNEIKKQYSKYSTLRIDIRNYGPEGNNVTEQSVKPAATSVRRPGWLPDGITMESVAGKMNVVLQCQGDGELGISLMGRDARDADGKRYPVWIDCTYFAVNGEKIFDDTKTVCHDKRFVYRKKVADGEVVSFEVAWSECQSNTVIEEFRQLQADLKKANEQVKITKFELKTTNEKLNEVKKQYAKYSTLRIDIRNYGPEGNNVTGESVKPAATSVRRPEWLPDGITMESVAGKMNVVLQCQGDGELGISLMGRDVRDAAGKCYPVWIDCTYFAVNGVVIFNDTKTVCYDKRYVYKKTVKDGELVTLDVTWSECRSNTVLDEYQQLQAGLKTANKKVKITEATLKESRKKTERLEQDKLKLTDKLRQSQIKAKNLDNKLVNIKNSWSYKLGSVITFIPRKIRGFLK